MRPLKLNQIIQNAGMVTPWTYEANLANLRAYYWDGLGRQYSVPELMDAQFAIIKRSFLQIQGARFFFADDRPDLPGTLTARTGWQG